MANIQIVVKNKSTKVQSFLIFNDKPAYSESVGQSWINVWGKAPGTGSEGGQTQFQIKEEYFAVCGMGPQKLQTDLIVSTADSQAVTLGVGEPPKGTLVPAMIEQEGIVFDKKDIKTIAKKGSYGISTKKYDLTKYQLAFCGLGLKGPFPQIQEVIPTSVWQAEPNQAYQITPKRVYYISTGSFHTGQIVDFAQFGSYATIDFTGRSEDVATVELLNNLSYTPPTYSFSSH